MYELLLRVVILKDFNLSTVEQKYVNYDFVLRLLDLLKSPDPRERDYLKTVVHRIYGKFMPLRYATRMTIVRELIMEGMQSGPETTSFDRTFGVAEYIEILVPIIDGFNEQLKPEHRQMYEQCLLPLHRLKNLGQFR